MTWLPLSTMRVVLCTPVSKFLSISRTSRSPRRRLPSRFRPSKLCIRRSSSGCTPTGTAPLWDIRDPPTKTHQYWRVWGDTREVQLNLRLRLGPKDVLILWLDRIGDSIQCYHLPTNWPTNLPTYLPTDQPTDSYSISGSCNCPRHPANAEAVYHRWGSR